MNKKFVTCFLACTMAVSAFGFSAAAETEETEAAAGASAESTEALSDDIYSFQLKLDGDVYTFPMSYADFLAYGWEYREDDMELAPNQYSGEAFYKGNLRAYVELINTGINTVPYSECMVGGIEIDSYDSEDAPDTTIEFAKGVTYGTSTLDDVKAAYGEASDVYEGDLYTKLTYEYDSYRDWSFYIDVETGILNHFAVSNFVFDEEANAAAMAEVSGDPTEAVLAYEAPTELGDDAMSGVVEFAGNLYQLPAPVSVFLENGFTLKQEDSDAVVAGQSFGWFSMLKDGQEFRGTARNYDKNATTIENCFVTEVESDHYDTDLPIMIPGGLTRDLNNEELMAVLENLSYEVSSDSDDYTYYTVQRKDDYDWSINITYSKEDDAVISIEYEKR